MPSPPELAAQIDPDHLRQLLETLLVANPVPNADPDIPYRAPSLDALGESADLRLAAVFLDVMATPPYMFFYTAHAAQVLKQLTNRSFGTDWFSWMEWLSQRSDIASPPHYAWWKGTVFSAIDPRFQDFLPNEVPHRIRLEEIVWGGVLVDGIPALDHPAFIEVEDADYLEPDEQVFGVKINGDARAYPLRIMNWHEMANDTVGGVPVALAYCTLCNSGILFDRRGEKTTYTFGSSGLLYRSNKLMYDRETKSLWNQFTGQPVVGSLTREDLQLKILPIVLSTWEEWLAEEPDTLVLSLETGYDRAYVRPGTRGAVYADYFASPNLMFPSSPLSLPSILLAPKDEVFVLSFDSETTKAYPLFVVQERRIIQDQVAGSNVVLLADESGGVRAYERGDREFIMTEDGALRDQDGNRWKITAHALVHVDKLERLSRLPGHVAYWFAYNAFRPGAPVYGLKD